MMKKGYNSIFKKNFSTSISKILKEFDIKEGILEGCLDGKSASSSGSIITSKNPHNNSILAQVKMATSNDYDRCIQAMKPNAKAVASIPMPVKGEILRDIGQELRDKKDALGELITLEVGKCYREGLGEVQEVIDMCDFTSGLSRTLNGQIFPSERKDHAVLEVWNPLGMVGVITAFNFPHAVLGWNFTLSFLCGNQTIWKGSEITPLTTLATANLIQKILKKHNAPTTALTAVIGDAEVGKRMCADNNIPLISFTGSTQVGKHVAKSVASRLGKTILELGGNNGMIVCADANINQAIPAIVFSAVGTAGQRCTTLRRLIIHESLYDAIREKLIKVYSTIKIGDPMKNENLIGPLSTPNSVKLFLDGLEKIKQQGGKILCGGEVIQGNYVKPAIVEIDPTAEIVKHEIFAPILYIFKFKTLDEAIALNNSVPQGLSSAMFTKNMSNMMKWMGPSGSDCGLININTGTSGAEIGGAFGGEKETGGGRESGSDSWKQYARRGASYINYDPDIFSAQ